MQPLDGSEKEHILNWAKSAILDLGDIPMTLFAPKEGIRITIEGHMPTSVDRARALALCGMELAEEGHKPEAVMLVHTAWMVSLQPEESPYISPSKDPRRREVLVLLYSTGVKAHHQGQFYYIERTADGPVFQEGPAVGEGAIKEISAPLLDAFWALNRM